MKRRLFGALLAGIFPPLGLVYAGRPWLAGALFAAVGAPGAALVLAGLGLLPSVAVLYAFVGLATVRWIWPLVVLALPPRSGLPWQRWSVYLGIVPASIAYALTTMIVARAWFAEPFQVPAASMTPNLVPGDFFLVRKLAFAVEPGAVIVFRHPVAEPPTDYVKRVVATGGQTVEVRDGFVYVDGNEVPRASVGEVPDVRDAQCGSMGARRAWEETLGSHTYVTYSHPDRPMQRIDYGPTRVPDGHVFVLGDNRDDSADSRFWGFVPVENIRGVATDRWLSLDPCDGRTRPDRVGPVP